MGRVLPLVLLAVIGSNAFGLQMGFRSITNNNSQSVLIGEQQLLLDIVAVDTDKTKLTFSNTGSKNFAISEIYIDDTAYLSKIDGIDDSLKGVTFREGANPGNLPAGNELQISFSANEALSVEAKNPSPKNGVNPGEWVSITYEINGNKTLNEVINAISNGNIRIGLHAQAFDNGCSESFLTAPAYATSVPEPATLVMLGVGSIGLLASRKRKTA